MAEADILLSDESFRFTSTQNSPSKTRVVSRSPQLSTANECDESTEQEQKPENIDHTHQTTVAASNSDDEATNSEAATTTTATTSTSTSSSGRMSNGERIPRLSAGPYHQRPTPVLTDRPFIKDFLNIPPPACPPPTEMRAPPPQWNPPAPPYRPDLTTSSYIEESQYEDPELDERAVTPHLSSDVTPVRVPLKGDSYEISASQQIRSGCNSMLRSMHMNSLRDDEEWPGENRQMLVQNPETGSFYVPPSSGQTTASSMSPQNQNFEKLNFVVPSTGGYTPTPHARLLSFDSTMVKDASHSDCGKKQRVLESFDPKSTTTKKGSPTFCTWKMAAICLLLALAFAFLIIFILLLSRDSSPTVHVQPSRSVFPISSPDSSSTSGAISMSTQHAYRDLKPLPDKFELGEEVEGDLPPGVITYTQFSLQNDNRIAFNISVGPRAQLVIYGRQTVVPSPAVHDFSDIIRADHLHIAARNDEDDDDYRRVKRTARYLLVRSAILIHYLLAGRWHLAILNDGDQSQRIRLSAGVAAEPLDGNDERSDDCRFDCAGRGECKMGKCHCFAGYSGHYCEESACPVLCSGNGLYSGGRCVCHEGYKGPDCDMLAHWCEVPNCNGHGVCDQNGQCLCDRGWKGDFCDKKDCDDPTCSNHGICHNAECFCEYGWYGKDCSESTALISATCLNPMELKSTKPIVGQDADAACNGRGRIAQGTGQCLCVPDYHGDHCELARCEVECMRGVCGDGICKCEKGWIGLNCAEKQCLAGCDDHGFCKNGTCICHKGWNGENCHIQGCPNDCNMNGACKMFSGQWRCACDASHFGRDCSLPIESDCDDDVDNDGDGLVDCEDSECCTYRSCSSSQLCTTVVQPRDVLLRLLPPVNADFYQQSRFLIQPDSVQRYADERQFNKTQASVVRGRVLSEGGSPLTGVRVSEASHPPLTGFTLTRSEDGGGAFDILVNGGRVVTLQFMRKPFEKLEKNFYVPWNEIVYVGDVRMHLANQPHPKQTDSVVPTSCCLLQSSHQIEPILLPSWLVNQYPGSTERSTVSLQILADSRTSYDVIPIPGTSGLSLVYDSSRAEKYRSTLLMKLLPAVLPETLRLVHLKVDVAGNYYENIFSAIPNLTHVFSWDQTNVYVQTLNGLVNTKVSIGYEYAGCEEHIIWTHRIVKLEGKKTKYFNIGSWSINVHHHYDFVHNVLTKGDGSVHYLDEAPQILETYIGTDYQRPINCPFCNEPISTAKLFRPEALAIGSDGSVFVGDYNLIRCASPTGSINTLLELSIADTAHPYYLAVDPLTDKLYISLPLRRQIWQIGSNPNDLSSNYDIVVGDGSTCSDSSTRCGDDGLADLAQLTFPKGITFDYSGNLYIADSRRIRVVKRDQTIRTLLPDRAFGPRLCYSESDDLSKINLEWPTSLSVDPLSGDLFILDTEVVLRVSIRFLTARVVLGKYAECAHLKNSAGNILPLLPINDAKAIAVGPDSTLYIVESNGRRLNQVRSMSVNGRPRLLIGRISKCDCDRVNCPCDNSGSSSATLAFLHSPSAIAISPDGTVFVADKNNYKVKVLRRIRAYYDDSLRQYHLNSPNTNELYIFNRNGLHIATKSLISDQYLYNFTYNVDTNLGRLTQIASTGGYALRLRRVNDTELILEAPSGIETVLTLHDFDRTLQHVRFPNGEVMKFSYFPGQYLHSKEVSHRIWQFLYDSAGRLASLTTPAGDTFTVQQQDILPGGFLSTQIDLNDEVYTTFSFSPQEYAESGVEERHVVIVDDGFIVDSGGYRTHYDGVSHPLIGTHETAILKRKLTLPTSDQPSRRELSLRFEWRGYVRRKDFTSRRDPTSSETRHVLQVGRRPRINGRNVFTVEYDREKRTDTIRNSGDNDVLTIEYNVGGQVVSITPKGSYSKIPSLAVLYDTHGRRRKLIWGNNSMEVSYDNQNRITSSAHGMKADFLRRKFLYPKGSLWTPSNVQLPSGERYRIRYDHHGDVSSIKTPSGDIHLFSRHASLDRIIRRYISPYANNSYIWTNDDEGRPREYFTPDGIHALVTAYDLYGRPTRIGGTADDITFKYLQFNGGDLPVEVQGRTYRRNIVRQGPLPIEVQETRSYISHGQKRFPECSATFTYEYDDFFRISSIATNIDGETIDLVRYEYDTRTGRLSKLGNFAFLEDGSIRRILGEKIVIEVDLREDRLERRRKILVNDIQTVQMSAEYDAIGRLEAIQWTIMGERRPTEKRSYNIDGMLTQLTMGESTDRRWTCYYDLDGRLKAVNDNKLILGPGGTPIMFGQLEYETDENGWVKRRGSVYFEMDVYGRVSRVFETNGIDIEYGYDEMSRIIWRRDGEGRFDRYFYAIHDRPYLISHFTSTSVSGVSEIFYDTYGIPIALRSSKTVFSIVTDPDHNVRFIFDNFGKLIREVVRNPLGHMIVDSNPTFVFPLGFMSSFDDSLTRIVIIGKNARPLDTYTGRFMTTPPEFDFTTASLFHPERICDPFRIFDAKTSEPLMIPFEIDQWMEMSGFSLSNVVPSVRHHSESSSNLILPDWNSPSTVCETSLVISPAFCSIPKKIVHFSQFLSVSASLVIPSVPPTASSGHPMTFSPFDSIGFRGIIFSSLSNKSVSIFAPYADILTKEALNSLFNECFRVPTDDLVGDPASEYLRESHFVSSTKPPDSSVYALLGDLFNISSKADKLTLQAGKTAIIIHFNSNIIKVRRELLEERKFWMEPRIWMLEAERARSNRSTRHAWTDTQLAELRSSGRVSGYSISYQPADLLPIATNHLLWVFDHN